MSVIKREECKLDLIKPGFEPMAVEVSTNRRGQFRIGYLSKVKVTSRKGLRTRTDVIWCGSGAFDHMSEDYIHMDNGEDVLTHIGDTRPDRQFLANEKDGHIYLVRRLHESK